MQTWVNDKGGDRMGNVDAPRRTSVFIVGGGPVGLAVGLLLDRFGIEAVIVEKSPTTTDHPKSRGCWVRTMEIFRQWGIEPKMRERGLQDNSDMFVHVESIAGREIGRSRPEPNLGQTPAWKCLVAQDAVEEEIYRVIERSKMDQASLLDRVHGLRGGGGWRGCRHPLG